MSENSDKNHLLSFSVILYYAVLIGMAVSVFFVGRYWWGLSGYAFVGGVVRIVSLTLGALVPVGIIWWYRTSNSQDSTGRKSFLRSILLGAIGIIGATTIFWLLRANAHFLGDGYTLLSTLALDNPIIKSREIGESLAHLWVKQAFGSGEQAALLSFQIISIVAGIIFLLATMITSLKLFKTSLQRILFVLGMSTGGYMLLFFGYVENYSLFMATTAVYGMVGLLGATGKINRWWAVLPLGIAIAMHILAVTLVPSALYLLLKSTRVGNAISKMSTLRKSILFAIPIAIIAVIFLYLYNTMYFFKLAFIPLIVHRFTVHGYTLFSLNHLTDFANLMFVLVPALVVCLPVWWMRRKIKLPSMGATLFLQIMVLSGIGTVFLLDPKLGMPRDWDLFSFAGVPVALLCFYSLLSNKIRKTSLAAIAALAVALNLIVLTPRVVTQTNEQQAVEQFRQYICWDSLRNINALDLLIDYHQKTMDSARALVEYKKWQKSYPELRINHKGLEFANSGKYREALKQYRRVIKLNPIFPAAYANIGSAMLELKQYDSAYAYLEIARGMNPYNPRVAYNYGSVLFYLEHYNEAERAWLEALSVDSTIKGAFFGLMRLSKMQNKRDQYFEYLDKVVALGGAPVAPLKELGINYLREGNYIRAREIFSEALEKGLDSAYVDSLQVRFPQLKF
ncbi:MAG: tetratricopeptide repeat protein [candidate division Zixibacteria bacterium]|nr:tetratricopeptide repeat protein [candidate division Zixibacteria bacterium]